MGLVLARLVEPWWSHSPVVQLAAFTPWALPSAVLAAVLLLGSQAWWRAGVALVLLAFLLAWVVPRGSGAASPGAFPLRVMTLNAEFGQADPQILMDVARRGQVDVLVVEELTPSMVPAIDGAGARAAYPYRDLHPDRGAAGTGIWSRYPVTPQGVLGGGRAMPQVVVTPPDGPEVTVIGIHTAAPVPGAVHRWRQDLATIRDAVGKIDGPLVVTGDFNASRDHSGFREVLAAGLVDAGDVRGAAPWPGLTWPAGRRFPPLTRIDHVLIAQPYVQVTKLQVVNVPGTDHHGLVAALTIDRGPVRK